MAADLFDVDLNRTLATLPRRLIVTVATHEYLPLTRNLLCSSLQWSAAAAVGILVAGADSWLCAELAPLHASVACVDPPMPHHLAASALEVYELKLRLAVRAAQLGHEVFMADGATVLFENPFASLPELPHASLLLSFQDRYCLHLSVCDTRTTPTPSPDHASTIFFFLAPEPSSAAALVDRAADLLRQEGPQNRSLYGDQEALREVLRRQRDLLATLRAIVLLTLSGPSCPSRPLSGRCRGTIRPASQATTTQSSLAAWRARPPCTPLA